MSVCVGGRGEEGELAQKTKTKKLAANFSPIRLRVPPSSALCPVSSVPTITRWGKRKRKRGKGEKWLRVRSRDRLTKHLLIHIFDLKPINISGTS